MDENRLKIVKVAIFTRLSLLILQFISNTLIPDHNAQVFMYPKPEPPSTKADFWVLDFLGGFLRWDAQYFMHIAKYGYSYENVLAFFPLYSLMGRFLADLLFPFGLFSYDCLLLLVFITLNFVIFVFSALALYDLSVIVLNRHQAFNVVVLFCYNPASVFFIAPYTECLFSYLTFKTMLNSVTLFKKYSVNKSWQIRDLVLIIPASLSSLTRSNGVLNSGFFIYALICLYLMRVQENKKWLLAYKFTIIIGFTFLFSILPFMIFQNWAYKKFCNNFPLDMPKFLIEFSQENNLVLPGQFSKHHQIWCFQKIPLSYSYVQSHYWDVGFLKYYQIKQIPNFLMAFPIFYIIVGISITFLQQFPKEIDKYFCWNLLFTRMKAKIFKPTMMVFVVHAMALTIFSVLCIHVQVTTRMLCSSSPILYWYCSFYFKNYQLSGNILKDLFRGKFGGQARLILFYFFVYFIVGTAMFCNFLPFT